MSLETYRKKRRFDRTPEPRGGSRKGGAEAPGPGGFVVQKHQASHLHYDFRLELQGALKSWAVPKGPSPDPADRRLAIHVEDHPLEYGGFEGVIPEGEYGGGAVLLWDRGRWIPEGDALESYREGNLRFSLEGEKLRGGWRLVRTGTDERGRERWLLMKRDDEHVIPGGSLVDEKPLSVATGRSIQEVARDRDRVWRSDRAGGGSGEVPPEAGEPGERGPAPAAEGGLDPAKLSGARPAPLPERPGVELATLVDTPPEGDGWVHEIKLDGYRVLCAVEDGQAVLLTRRGNDWTDRFPRVASAAASLSCRSALLDGEVVIVDSRGLSDFQALQNALGDPGRDDLYYYVFDLRHLDGHDLDDAPLVQRKELLESLIGPAASVIRFSDHLRGGGSDFFREACELGVEGIISKRASAPYREGRGRDWLKTKCILRQEFVVAGFTEGQGSRQGIGSLILGLNEAGALRYTGRVGTGFTDTDLRNLQERLLPLESDEATAEGAPRTARGREIRWVEPVLVAEVAFSEWTRAGVIRHASFQGLREDKAPAEVVRETEIREEEPASPAGSPDGPKGIRRSGASGEQPVPSGRMKRPATRIGGVRITHPDRVLFPDEGFTKGAVASYWEAVADVALPLIGGRPLTLYRCPEGIAGECFFQKHANQSVPDAVPRVRVPDEKDAGAYMAVDDLESLLSLTQLGVLEFHVWNARRDRLDRPDRMVLDLDPGPGVEWPSLKRSALALRDLLEELGLRAFAQATGGKGLHLVVPLARRSTWDQVKSFARDVSRLLERSFPERFTSRAAHAERKGRIYVDYLRNAEKATAIGTFSPRARPGARIAFPLTWAEVERAAGLPVCSIGDPDRARAAMTEPDGWEDFRGVRQYLTVNSVERLAEALEGR